jgi:hypothetical protein
MKDCKMTEKTFMAKNHCLKDFSENKSLSFGIRNFIYDKFSIWDLWDILPYKLNMWYYDKLRPIFKPQHSRLRKAIPKQWCDITSLIVDVNFEFIKTFYEEEYIDGVVDWSATDCHKEFAEWLELSYKWITKRRPELEKERDEAYPETLPFEKMFEEVQDSKGNKMYQMVDSGIPYDIKYKEVNRLEKVIEEKDTEILTQLIKRRDYFWT